ncbi:hypothetical protein CEXT_362981 [Caerostris extrusa]|uniref:Uncharacterized protein n=1 Tax=Caerostris extrusa TaxID=172846 RepID=A0AAV4X253_CAEEX|nr:hypothetical protein CEXT_362981 [Caerostris extrusa]
MDALCYEAVKLAASAEAGLQQTYSGALGVGVKVAAFVAGARNHKTLTNRGTKISGVLVVNNIWICNTERNCWKQPNSTGRRDTI